MKVTSLWLMCPAFLWVGLMGGASYVNVMHNLLNLESLKKSEIEGALVLCLIMIDIGVLAASIFSLVVDETLLA